MGELDLVAPTFLLIGMIFITGYLAPYILGRLDDWKRSEIEKFVEKNGKPKQFKCSCGTLLEDHYCSGCNVLNSSGIKAYCPECDNHPTDPIPC